MAKRGKMYAFHQRGKIYLLKPFFGLKRCYGLVDCKADHGPKSNHHGLEQKPLLSPISVDLTVLCEMRLQQPNP